MPTTRAVPFAGAPARAPAFAASRISCRVDLATTTLSGGASPTGGHGDSTTAGPRSPNGARSPPLVGAGAALRRLLHGHPRRGDRDRRAALDRGGPRFLGAGAAVGGQRLRAHLRRTAPTRRPGGRSARAPPSVHGRRRFLHACVAPVWAGLVGQGAD